MNARVCSLEGCTDPVRARRWCNRHYIRWRVHGDPTAGGLPQLRGAGASARFWQKVGQAEALDCWLWEGALDSDGYGSFQPAGRSYGAHRFAYEQLRAQVPPGLELDHMCRNRACVNPWHLDPVTGAVNTWRGQLSAVTRERHRRNREAVHSA